LPIFAFSAYRLDLLDMLEGRSYLRAEAKTPSWWVICWVDICPWGRPDGAGSGAGGLRDELEEASSAGEGGA
jgi:hypothetical protein